MSPTGKIEFCLANKCKEKCSICSFTPHAFPFSLDELKEFIRTTIEGLAWPVGKGDHSGLVEVMSHLLAIRDRQTATDKMFEPLRDTIFLLERYGVVIPDQVYSQLEVEKGVGFFFYFTCK